MSTHQTRVNPSEETVKIGPIGIRFLLTGDDSGGSASVFEVRVPAGQKLVAPAHKNDAYEEVLYGIEGVLTWTVDGTPIEVGPGQALCIPRGAAHRFDNLGSEDVKQLCVITPATMGPAYFREAAELIGAAGGGPQIGRFHRGGDQRGVRAIRRGGRVPSARVPHAPAFGQIETMRDIPGIAASSLTIRPIATPAAGLAPFG